MLLLQCAVQQFLQREEHALAPIQDARQDTPGLHQDVQHSQLCHHACPPLHCSLQGQCHSQVSSVLAASLVGWKGERLGVAVYINLYVRPPSLPSVSFMWSPSVCLCHPLSPTLSLILSVTIAFSLSHPPPPPPLPLSSLSLPVFILHYVLGASYNVWFCLRLSVRYQQCLTAFCTKPVSVSGSPWGTSHAWQHSIQSLCLFQALHEVPAMPDSILYKACVCFRLFMRYQPCLTAFCTKPFTFWICVCTLGPKPSPMWSVALVSVSFPPRMSNRCTQTGLCYEKYLYNLPVKCRTGLCTRLETMSNCPVLLLLPVNKGDSSQFLGNICDVLSLAWVCVGQRIIRFSASASHSYCNVASKW